MVARALDPDSGRSMPGSVGAVAERSLTRGQLHQCAGEPQPQPQPGHIETACVDCSIKVYFYFKLNSNIWECFWTGFQQASHFFYLRAGYVTCNSLQSLQNAQVPPKHLVCSI